MAKQRYVNTKFWSDPYIVSLDTHNKLLFLYLLTNPYTEICGAYEISLRQIEFDTGLVDSLIQAGVRKLQADKKIVYKDGWVFLPNWIKNQSLNPSVIKGIVRSLENAPKWIKDKIGWNSLGIASIEPVGTKLNLTKPNLTEQNINKDVLKNSRELLKEKWGKK